MTNSKTRVVILGGGFGGVYVAVHLGKLLSQRELNEIEIVLVNRENYIVFQPLLPEVISGSVELNHVIAPIRRMAPKANLFTRDVESIDPMQRLVTLEEMMETRMERNVDLKHEISNIKGLTESKRGRGL